MRGASTAHRSSTFPATAAQTPTAPAEANNEGAEANESDDDESDDDESDAPNSIPPERGFSVLNDTFDDDQGNSLADYIELCLQLQFNSRTR